LSIQSKLKVEDLKMKLGVQDVRLLL